MVDSPWPVTVVENTGDNTIAIIKIGKYIGEVVRDNDNDLYLSLFNSAYDHFEGEGKLSEYVTRGEITQDDFNKLGLRVPRY